jgi:hypothetical protein
LSELIGGGFDLAWLLRTECPQGDLLSGKRDIGPAGEAGILRG